VLVTTKNLQREGLMNTSKTLERDDTNKATVARHKIRASGLACKIYKKYEENLKKVTTIYPHTESKPSNQNALCVVDF